MGNTSSKGPFSIAMLVYWRVPTVTKGIRQPQKTQEVTPAKVSKIHRPRFMDHLFLTIPQDVDDIGAVFKNQELTFRCTDWFLRDP